MNVSIVIPVYHVSAYIERCVESVMVQTYSNLECILVNDCSPDNSVFLIEQKIAGYTGNITFKILHHKQNKGLSGARNTGIKASTGDYLYFLDSDDELCENCMELLVAIADKYPGVDIVQGSSERYPAQTDSRNYLIHSEVPAYTTNQPWLKKSMLDSELYPLTAWNKLIKKEFLTSNRLYYQEGIVHEDEHWNFFAAKVVRSMAFCKKPTYKHYIRENSIMTSKNHQKSILSWFYIINDWMNSLDPDLLRFQHKMILRASFGNLARITYDAETFPVGDLLKRQREIMKSFVVEALKSFRPFELLLLMYFFQPLCFLKFLCRKNIRGVYFRILKYLV